MSGGTQKRTVRLILTVTYEHQDHPGILPDEQMCHCQLDDLVRFAANRGLLSGDNDDLVVDDYTYNVETVGTT
jgi:hypothetical protein